MSMIHETKVLSACHVLFGDGVRLDRDFLLYLQPSGAKAAYRRRAKEVHPDLHAAAPPELRNRRSELFRELVAAHELVCEFFRQREAGQGASPLPTGEGRSQHGSRSPRSTPTDASPFYRGQLPRAQLTIGRYCYYRGVIPYSALIEALTWQRQQRPVIGELARRRGWLNEEGMRQVFAARDSGSKFGEKAVALGILSAEQVRELLRCQRSRSQRLGQFFIERGYVSEKEMNRLTREMRLHNAAVFATGRCAPSR